MDVAHGILNTVAVGSLSRQKARSSCDKFFLRGSRAPFLFFVYLASRDTTPLSKSKHPTVNFVISPRRSPVSVASRYIRYRSCPVNPNSFPADRFVVSNSLLSSFTSSARRGCRRSSRSFKGLRFTTGLACVIPSRINHARNALTVTRTWFDRQ